MSVSQDKPQKRESELRLLWRFLPYARRHWRLALWAGLAMVLFTGASLAFPWINKYVIDGAILGRNTSLLWKLLMLWLAIVLARELSSLVESYFLTLLRQKTLFRVRLDLFRHIERLPLDYFKSTNTGYLVSRLANDVEAIGPVLGENLLLTGQNLLLILGGVPLAFCVNSTMALFVLMLVPLFIINQRAFGKKTKELAKEVQESQASLWGAVHDTFSGIAVVKQFGRELAEARKFTRSSKRVIRSRIRFRMWYAAGRFTLGLFTGLGPLLMVGYAGLEIIGGGMTLGDLVAFSVYVGILLGPITGLFNFTLGLKAALGSMERISQLLDLEPELDQPVSPHRPAGLSGRLELENVSFAYGEASPVLQGLELHVPRGELVVIHGRNGTGKTTLVNLLLGFYEPDQGRIRYGETVLEVSSKTAVRGITSIVSRDSFFFNAPISENIGYGKAGATQEEIIAAARMGHAHEFIQELPDGFDTLMGERGEKLSQGQKQRIALARALIRKPEVLLLDEGTSSIDRESKELIWDSLLARKGKQTIIVITHEEEELARAESVYELAEGRLHRRGSHPPEARGERNADQ